MKVSCYKCAQKLELSELDPFSKLSCPVCESEIIVPKPFGDNLLEEELGSGEMADVYRAMDATLDREAAVKVMKKEFNQTELPQAFINEARAASAINHPNVIPIYSCGEQDGMTYITMQYMEGGSLKKMIGTRPAAKDLCKWFIDVTKALDSAAVHGVTHQGIKPSNIFLDRDGNIKVGDFGLAQIHDDGKPLFENNVVSPKVTLDMSYYLCPEKITSGRQDVTGEVFSLGATMFHIACGEPPYSTGNIADNVKARFEGPPNDPSKFYPELDSELCELIRRMLSIFPSDRPKTYKELIDELDKILERLKQDSTQPEAAIAQKVTPEAKAKAKAKPKASKSNGHKPRKSPKVDPRPNKRVITVSRRNQETGTYQSGNTFHTVMKTIPIVIIALTILVAIAHLKNVPVYNRTIRPFIENMIGKAANEVQAVKPIE